jgi:hypothetical protein
MPLPKLNYIDKSIKIKDEVLEGLQVAANVPAENDNDFFDNSLFGDDNPLPANTMNESEFLDLKILNFKHEEDQTNRVSLFSDVEGNVVDMDKSLFFAKAMSQQEYKMTTVPKVNLEKMRSGNVEDFEAKLNADVSTGQR